MKKMLFGLVAAAMLSSAAVAQEAVVAEEKSPLIPSISVELAYKSRYMSDGNIVNERPIVTPDLFLSWGIGENAGVYADLWAAFDLDDKPNNRRNDAEEVDYTFGGWYSLDKLTIDACWICWYYPKALRNDGCGVPGDTTQLIQLNLTYSVPVNDKFSVTPGVRVRNDYENEEWQIKPYVSTNYQINEKLSLGNCIAIFWQNAAWTAGNWQKRAYQDAVGHWMPRQGTYRNGFTNVQIDASLNYAICDCLSVGPFGSIGLPLRKCTRRAWGAKYSSNSTNNFNTMWGVKIAANF